MEALEVLLRLLQLSLVGLAAVVPALGQLRRLAQAVAAAEEKEAAEEEEAACVM